MVFWAHLLSFNQRFLGGMFMEPMCVTSGRAKRDSSQSSTFGSPTGNAVGMRVDAGKDDGCRGVVMSVGGICWGRNSRTRRKVLVKLVDVKSINGADDVSAEL